MSCEHSALKNLLRLHCEYDLWHNKPIKQRSQHIDLGPILSCALDNHFNKRINWFHVADMYGNNGCCLLVLHTWFLFFPACLVGRMGTVLLALLDEATPVGWLCCFCHTSTGAILPFRRPHSTTFPLIEWENSVSIAETGIACHSKFRINHNTDTGSTRKNKIHIT